MNRARQLTVPIFALCAAVGAAQTQPAPAQIKTVQDLVAKIREREKAVKSVEIEMVTRGTFPGAMAFETTGKIRVLGTTHFHTSMTVRFGGAGKPGAQGPAEFTSESETLRTPDGVLMRNKDPRGEVFVRMDNKLLADLEAASKFLGGDDAVTPADSDLAEGPLGSMMLEDLDKMFELEVTGPKVTSGTECYVVKGPRRAGAAVDDEVMGEIDRVELLVRRADMAVIRMTQFDGATSMTDVEITSLVLDRPMKEESFEIAVPNGVNVLDAMDFPPQRQQIDRVFAEASAKGWKRGEKSGDGEGR